MPKHKFEGHERSIQSFIFLHDNVHIVSGSEDGKIRKWECDTGNFVGVPWKGEGGGINALALSPDGRTIACGRNDGSVQRWDTYGEMIEDIWTGHSSCVRMLSWSPRGGHIASGSFDGTILIRKAESGEVEVGPIETKQGKVYSLAYSPPGDKIASGGSNGTICIWDSNTGKLLVGPIKGLGGWVKSVVWSSDNSKLEIKELDVLLMDNFARVFDSISGTLLHRFEHDHTLESVALPLKNDNILACVGQHGVAKLWNIESHRPLNQPFGPPDYNNHIFCVSFSRDGRYLAYCGGDNKIALWIIGDVVPEIAVSALLIGFH
ncbi:WD40 repeat-like protein [Rhizopogon vinicolor AM-OR11-026]|uniref:WD40 repeat-like protein n=1 Tax=Rhizopogon vinicolor AM-OR11-026 TaxID=1314800 RepID=A0A1B7MTU1_9AGAM|nr:WD40 repeat-like protein [Rhizopogon vinicolor AM-OR11-026]